MDEKVFQKYYRKLNENQKKAVDTVEGPVMVVAGPGTGKTQILTLRIANILRKTTDRANQLLNELFKEANYSQKKEINYWRGWAFMFADKWDSAAVYFNKVDYDHELKILANGVKNDKYSVTFALGLFNHRRYY